MSRALLYPILDWPALSIACSKLSSVNPGEEPLKRSLSNLIEDFGSSSFLKNCMTLHSEDVVDTADTKALAKESKFCLWVLAQLGSFVRGLNDICFGQEFHPERVASGCGCGDRGKQSHLVNLPLTTQQITSVFSAPICLLA